MPSELVGRVRSACTKSRYGIHLWGMVLQREPLRELGTTMLTLCAMTIREFFLMKEDNPHHPEDFVTNHVTGGLATPCPWWRALSRVEKKCIRTQTVVISSLSS